MDDFPSHIKLSSAIYVPNNHIVLFCFNEPASIGTSLLLLVFENVLIKEVEWKRNSLVDILCIAQWYLSTSEKMGDKENKMSKGKYSLKGFLILVISDVKIREK